MTRMLFDHRYLNEEDVGNQTSTTLAPTPSGGSNGFGPVPTPAPLSPPSNGSSDDKDGSMRLKGIIVLVLLVVLLMVIYKIYQTCRLRREQYLMRLRSVQADQVLGDMQMIPSEDPDSELL